MSRFDEKVAEITGTNEPRVLSPKRPKTDLLKCFADNIILEEAEVDTHNGCCGQISCRTSIPFHRGNSLSWWAEKSVFHLLPSCFRDTVEWEFWLVQNLVYLTKKPTE